MAGTTSPSSAPTGRPRAASGWFVWLGLTLLAGGVGAWASASAPSFYAELTRPAWAPPASWFGPVWSALYLMMATAAWLVWRAHGLQGRARGALALFVLQLGFNALWTWLFFVWRSGLWAFVDISLLWLLIAATTARFWTLQRAAAGLMLPYLASVSFAAALSWAVWHANPGLLG